MVNCAVIMGRLVANPELRVTRNSGVSVTSITVAVDRKFSGEDKQADFIDVIAWRGTAEFICNYFRKGSMIAIQGFIQTRMYEDKNGKKRKAVEIVADNVSFCGGKNTETENTADSMPAPAYIASDDDNDFREIPEDDLPF